MDDTDDRTPPATEPEAALSDDVVPPEAAFDLSNILVVQASTLLADCDPSQELTRLAAQGLTHLLDHFDCEIEAAA
jgi:hypothetical protein